MTTTSRPSSAAVERSVRALSGIPVAAAAGLVLIGVGSALAASGTWPGRAALAVALFASVTWTGAAIRRRRRRSGD